MHRVCDIVGDLERTLEVLALDPVLVDWARHQPDLRQAWERCDRGDWLLQIATRVAVPRRLVVQAAVDCAGMSLGRIPREEFRPRRALHLASAWVRGEASGSECWAHGFAAANAAGELEETTGSARANDAAMAAACAAFACDADADCSYYAQRAHAAQAAFLAACAFDDEVIRAHRLAASIVRDRVPFHAIHERIDSAVRDSELPPPGPTMHEDALYAFALGYGES
ncbi:MAG: hypothetical protein AAGF12_04020 [Myxococcota bacterium]